VLPADAPSPQTAADAAIWSRDYEDVTVYESLPVDRWLAFHRIVDEEMVKVRPIVAGDRLKIDLMRWGLRRDIGRLVRRAALADAPLVPSEFEVSFGMRTAQAGRKDGVDVGPARLSGKIDRIDTDPMMTARAIVVDYKTSTIPIGSEIRDKGELQVPLYLLALREILGREPVGGLFISIRKGAMRGIVDEVIGAMQGVAVPLPMALARAPLELVALHLPDVAAAGPETTLRDPCRLG
jgi:hypothetical protein